MVSHAVDADAAAGADRAKRRKPLRWHGLSAVLFLAPFLVPFVALWCVPIAKGFYLSLTNARLGAETRFIGIDNYRRLIGDPTFHQALRNTVFFVVENVPLLVVVGLMLALLINQPLFGRTAIRASFVAPYLVTGSAVAIIWQFFLNPQTGLVNHWLQAFGLPGQSWLAQPGQAMTAITFITLWWRVGLPLIVLLAALQDVPKELYEAARVDGANAWQRFWNVTVPNIAPVLVFVTIIRLIDSWKVFAQTYLVTGGGPNGSTRVILQQLYEAGFQDFQTGYAAAIGWTLTFIVLLVTLAQFLLIRRING